ncbi:hypothetical protein [Desulfocurvibacter africanus]|nr:hypothetical protein [Desulfocurvibacter africanus]
MLASITMPDKEQENDRTFLRQRHALADDLRRTRQCIRSPLLCLGIWSP